MDLHQLIARGSISGPYHRQSAVTRITRRVSSARTTWRLWRRNPASLGAAVRAVARDLFNV